ncbi:MAG: hypothetical protein AAFN07_10300 [Pseudomonadota bacterium]
MIVIRHLFSIRLAALGSLCVSAVLLTGCGTSGPLVNSGCDGVTALELLDDPASGVGKISAKTADLRELPCHWFSTEESDTYFRATRTSQEFAKASFVYAIASFEVYEDPQDLKEGIPFPSQEDWHLLVPGTSNPRTGFFAKSWLRRLEDGSTELVVAYQGTGEEFQDWFRGNLVVTNFFFLDTQFDDALEFANSSIKEAVERGGFDRLTLTGHSLGGGLAQYAQRFVPDSRAVVFDPSPNKGRIYSMLRRKLPVDSLRISERGEVLDYLRKTIDFDRRYDQDPYGPGKKTRWMNFYKGGPVAQHDMQDLAMSLVKVAATVGDPAALDVIRQLESCRTPIQLRDPFYQLRSARSTFRRGLRENHKFSRCAND